VRFALTLAVQLVAMCHDLVEDAAYGAVLEVHAALWRGEVCPACSASYGELLARPSHDVFGVAIDALAGGESVRCPHCSRSVQTSRFAPHLEKCMGMGRASARATRNAPAQPPTVRPFVGVHLLSAAAQAAALSNANNAANTAAATAADDGGGDDESFDGGGAGGKRQR